MERTAIITDSVAIVPPDIRRDLDIHVIPLVLEVDGVSYRDGVDIAPAEFYELMKRAKGVPRTSQPPPGWYLQAYAECAQRADRVLCLTAGSKLSGTHGCAVLAARLFVSDAPPGTGAVPVEVLDTGFGAVPEGLVVIEAARAARAGAPFAEVVRRAREVMARACLLLVVDTLEYLVRGGHVPKVAAAAAGVIGLKPLIGFRDGDAVPIGAARGNEQAMATILKRLGRDRERAETRTGRAPRVIAGVMHAASPDRGERLLGLIREELRPAESFLADFTPVMGAHTGPGVFGVGYLME